MDTSNRPVETIDDYIARFPPEVQALLQTFRQTVRAAAPEAVEAITYQVPTFKLYGKNLVSFGAAKNHIGFYPTPAGVAPFEKELAGYNTAKGSIQFPMDKKQPVALIRKIVKYRVQAEKKKRKV